MENVLYNAMNGAKVNMDRLALTTNNLANNNTPGFKADLFQAQNMYLNGGQQSAGTAWVVESVNGTDFTDGELIVTGRDLDIAIQGKGWFAVKDAQGRESYTRAGNFKIDPNGIITTAAGLPVMGDGGPISIPPAQRMEVGTDGTISVVPLGANPNELAVIDRFKLVSPKEESLVKGSDGLMKLSKGGSAPVDPTIVVVKGALEGSNINPVTEMVAMIGAGREFDSQMKVMAIVDETNRQLAQILHD